MKMFFLSTVLQQEGGTVHYAVVLRIILQTSLLFSTPARCEHLLFSYLCGHTVRPTIGAAWTIHCRIYIVIMQYSTIILTVPLLCYWYQYCTIYRALSWGIEDNTKTLNRGNSTLNRGCPTLTMFSCLQSKQEGRGLQCTMLCYRR